jgi:hypothetical protein
MSHRRNFLAGEVLAGRKREPHHPPSCNIAR